MSIIPLSSQNFSKEVLSSGVPVIVDFWADWCDICSMQSEITQAAEIQISAQKLGKICRVNVDESPEIALKYGISSIPSFIMFNHGKKEQQTTGLHQKNSIINMFKSNN